MFPWIYSSPMEGFRQEVEDTLPPEVEATTQHLHACSCEFYSSTYALLQRCVGVSEPFVMVHKRYPGHSPPVISCVIVCITLARLPPAQSTRKQNDDTSCAVCGLWIVSAIAAPARELSRLITVRVSFDHAPFWGTWSNGILLVVRVQPRTAGHKLMSVCFHLVPAPDI